MRLYYVEQKDFKDLYTSFVVSFGSRKLDVFVWRTVRGLYRNTNFPKKNYLGAYIGYPYGKRRRGLFGELHLLKRMIACGGAQLIGAGYVAHELQHFMLDWLTDHTLYDPDSIRRLNEPAAWLCGEVTRLVWSEWYKIEKRGSHGRKGKQT